MSRSYIGNDSRVATLAIPGVARGSSFAPNSSKVAAAGGLSRTDAAKTKNAIFNDCFIATP
jgi:hypothetical protein